MKIKEIFNDGKTVIKDVDYMGDFFYRVIYIFDEDGYVEKTIRKYKNGFIEIQ